MKVLLVSCRFPADLEKDVQGTFRRFYLFLDALKAIAQLEILFFVPPSVVVDYSRAAIAERERHFSAHWGVPVKLWLCPQRYEMGANPPATRAGEAIAKVKQQFAPIFNFREQRSFFPTSAPKQQDALEACLDRQPDAIFCHRLEVMAPILKTRRSLPPIFFDLDDIEHIAFARQIRQPPTRWLTKLYYLQLPALCWGERRSIQQSLRTFVCSNRDREYLARRWKLSGVTSVPNAIAIPPPQFSCAEPTLMFLGGYYYFPNLNAANFLIESVWPLIQQARPDAKLMIAGTHPENIHSYEAAPPGVEFTGFVEDLDALYRRSRVVCCPILSGSGTRVKMIEAAAYGKAIVATRVGAEGLDFKDGQDYLQRDTAEAFASACLELLDNLSLCHRLGASARLRAIERYDRASIVRQIESHIQSAMARAQPARRLG